MIFFEEHFLISVSEIVLPWAVARRWYGKRRPRICASSGETWGYNFLKAGWGVSRLQGFSGFHYDDGLNFFPVGKDVSRLFIFYFKIRCFFTFDSTSGVIIFFSNVVSSWFLTWHRPLQLDRSLIWSPFPCCHWGQWARAGGCYTIIWWHGHFSLSQRE